MVVRLPCIHPRPYEKTIKGTAEREKEKKITNKVKEYVTCFVPLSIERRTMETESDGSESERQRKDSTIHQPSAGVDDTCAAAAT